MSSRPPIEPPFSPPGRWGRSLAFRLAVWYAVIFTLSSFLAFLVFYFSVSSLVHGRVDGELREDWQELAEGFESGGLAVLKAEISEEAKFEDADRLFYRLIRPDGSEIVATNLATWHGPIFESAPPSTLSPEQPTAIVMRSIPDKPYEVRVFYGYIAPDILFQAGIVLQDEHRMMSTFRNIFAVTMTLVFFLAAWVGWFMARRALSGVEDVTQAAWTISRGSYEQRVPVKNRGLEIERMARMFNHMADHIQTVLQEMREMTDNIAHDLKSPITRLRGIAEVTLSRVRSVPEYQGILAGTVEECDYLLGMINAMLDISEIEAGIAETDLGEIDIAELARDACDLFGPLAESKGLGLKVDAPESLPVRGSLPKIQRLLGNLLENAVKYTPESGEIAVSVSRREDGKIALTVRDTGAGISGDDLPFIFDRFFRCDESRSQTGSGLGLCLVRAIVRAHGGEIDVQSEPGRGARFRVLFPESA